MPTPAAAVTSLPASAAASLHSLGNDIQIARQRRGESLRAWAKRMDVSVPTLVRMEQGDASVGMGVYATALFLVGLHKALGTIAAPENDSAALAADIARALQSKVAKRGRVRAHLDSRGI